MQVIRIKKRSFLFRFNTWWNFIGLPFVPSFENRRNRCSMFWFTVFSVLVGWPIIFPLAIAIAAILCAILIIVAMILFLFGRRFDKKKGDFVQIENLPRIFGYRIYPIWLPLLGTAAFLSVLFRRELMRASTVITAGIPTLATAAGKILLVLAGLACVAAIVWAIVLAVSAIRKGDMYRAVKSLLAAKKARYCPPVEFIDS